MKEFYKLRPYFFLAVSLIYFSSCARYSAQFKNESEIQLPTSKLAQTIYLIGDGGGAPENSSTPLFEHLKDLFTSADQNSTTIWLGDNIYPVGLAPKDHEDYPLGLHRINTQLNTLSDYKGKSFFIPGNHDWYKYGDDGILRQEELIEKTLAKQKFHEIRNQEEYFVPSATCGDVKEVIINDRLVVLLMDSQWFLSKVGLYPSNHCVVHTQQDFEDQLLGLTKKHLGKSIVFAAHHPVYTYGKHGGNNSLTNHFFPLRQLSKKLWIPLPFIGTASNKGRTVVTEQDVNHLANKKYQEIINKAMALNKKSILVSGHEHCLQFIRRNGAYYLVSGSGSKKSPVQMGEGSLFAMGEHGYAKLLYYENGETWVQFWALNKKTSQFEAYYTYMLKH